MGTGQAMLDYVIPYVNERKAFGEPISHRQAVAFTVSDLAIEVDGMRLATLRAAALADAGKPFSREAALARHLCSERGMAGRLRRRADARRARLRQGVPGRALVPRPARGRRDRGSAARLMINLEIPRKFEDLVAQAHQVATEVFRPISRKYDLAEHEYPKELDMLAALIDGMNEAGEAGAASGAAGVGGRHGAEDGDDGNRNGSNMSTLLGVMELCWGDVGLLLSMPRQGLGNSAIAAVADDEQLERFGGKWAAMAITEPEAGSDTAAIRTTAVRRRRRVRAQRREDLRDLRRARRAAWWCGPRSTPSRAARRSSRSWSSARTRA